MSLAVLLLSTWAVSASTGELLLENPAALHALQGERYHLGALAFDAPTAELNQALAATPGWRSITARLAADLRELYGKDPQHGVGMRFSHRGFDPAWWSSPNAYFELVAVVNRADRAPFAPHHCGELRFVYRLAYVAQGKRGHLSSRLPMTVNVVFLLPRETSGCGAAADALAHPERRGPLKSVEVNLQSERWPSTVRPDLGGHADYLMRAFRPRPDGTFAPGPLENTPDVAGIRSLPQKQKRFLQWLSAPGLAERAQDGTALLPEDLAATRAVSVAPHGLARGQNRPFTTLATALGARAPDPKALRALDGLSCVGCHQSRSIAGFHMLGAEPVAMQENVLALAVAHSPHLEEDLPRRERVLTALRAGQVPSAAHPPAERPFARGASGDACGLLRAPDWTCAPGFACVAGKDPDVGMCQPVAPRAGTACRDGGCGEGPTGGVCEAPAVGFPGGMCSAGCDGLAENDTHDVCGAIAVLTPFNDCLARGEPFATCARHVRPARLQRCSDAHPCRPDYVCAGRDVAHGACMPPYFLPQLRVDGHPNALIARPRAAPRGTARP